MRAHGSHQGAADRSMSLRRRQFQGDWTVPSCNKWLREWPGNEEPPIFGVVPPLTAPCLRRSPVCRRVSCLSGPDQHLLQTALRTLTASGADFLTLSDAFESIPREKREWVEHGTAVITQAFRRRDFVAMVQATDMWPNCCEEVLHDRNFCEEKLHCCGTFAACRHGNCY